MKQAANERKNLQLVTKHISSDIFHSKAKGVWEMPALAVYNKQETSIIYIFLGEPPGYISLGLNVL